MSMPVIHFAIEEARRRGLDVKTEKPHRGSFSRLLIEGRPCQAVPARRFRPSRQYPKAECVQLYLPRTRWPDFLIYVLGLEDSERPVFYIVPRGDMSADTARTPASLESYKDAWHSVQMIPSGERTKREFKELSTAIRAVVKKAREKGLSVSLFNRPPRRLPNPYQHRALIQGQKCQIMTAPRCSASRDHHSWKTVNIKDPKDKWGEFVIYAVNPPEKSHRGFFIIPRGLIKRTTSRTLSSPWLEPYADAWDLLA